MATYAELSGPVYGLRSASPDWFKTLSKWLESEGYYPKHNERCVFINDKGFTVVTYVDDLITRGTREETDRFYSLLNKRFDCKESTELNPNNALSFLGFDIKCEDVNPNLITSSNKQVTQQGKVRIISIDQEECVNQACREMCAPFGG